MEAREYLEVLKVEPLSEFRLNIQFSNGTSKEIDLSHLLKAPPPVFEPLTDRKKFTKVFINPVGGIAWDSGADLSAEYLFRL